MNVSFARSRVFTVLTSLAVLTAGRGTAIAQQPVARPAGAQPRSSQRLPPPTPTVRGAQPLTGAPWWKDEAFKHDLGLTAEQSTRIDGIFEATLPQLRQGYDDLDRLEDKLSHMIEQGADEASITHAIDKVEATRSSLNKTRTLMHYHMRLVLNADQRMRFTALFEKRQQEQRQQNQQPLRRPS